MEKIKPFILTRDAAQAAVFGAGYPSIPTMSIDEYLAEEVKRGNFITGGGSASGPSTGTVGEKREQKPEEEECTDEYQYKKREWDEFTDFGGNKKGYGNRYNRS